MSQQHHNLWLSTRGQEENFLSLEDSEGPSPPSRWKQFKQWAVDRLGWKEAATSYGESEFERKTKAFREISEAQMIRKPLLIGKIITSGQSKRPTTAGSKFDQLVDVLGGDSNQLGLLDLASLGIFRFFKNMLKAPGDDGCYEMTSEKESGVHRFFRHLLSIPFYLQQTLAVILAIGLTVTGVLPFIHFVLYPQVDSHEEYDNAKLRRQIFFNPGTWMLVFLLLVGINLIIKAANPLVLGDAAAALAIMQTVFAGIAALMLVAAVVSLTVHAVSSLVEWVKERKSPRVVVSHLNEIDGLSELSEPVPTQISSPSRQSDIRESDYTRSENGYIQYHDEKIKGWMNVNPNWGKSLYFVTALGVLTALTLTIGYCIDPAGVFSFMEPVFSFVGGMFAQGLQSAGALPGLDALASLSEPALQLIGNIFTGVVLVSASIFIPNLMRQFSPPDIGQKRPDEETLGGHHQVRGEGQEIKQGQQVTAVFSSNLESGGITFNANESYPAVFVSQGDEEIILRIDNRDLTFPENRTRITPVAQIPQQFGAPHSGGYGFSSAQDYSGQSAAYGTLKGFSAQQGYQVS